MNEINFIYFAKQSDSSYSRGVAHKAIRDYTKSIKPQYISEVAYKVLGCKPISYTDMKKHNASSQCIWEHTIPVNTIFKNIIDHDMNLNEIKSYLDATIISIVTVEEDSKLTNNGFRDSRENWIEAYTESNIKLIPYNHDLEFYKKFYDTYFSETISEEDLSLVDSFIRSIDFIKVGKSKPDNGITSSMLKSIFSRYLELNDMTSYLSPYDFTLEVRKEYPIKRASTGRIFDGIYLDMTDSKDIKAYKYCFSNTKLDQLKQ